MSSKLYKKLGLTKQQMNIAIEISKGEDFDGILNRHRIHLSRFHLWLEDKRFSEYLDCCINFAFLQARMIIAGYAVTAAVKLIGLLSSDKPETARKACLDILKGPVTYSKAKDETNGEENILKKVPKVLFGSQVLDEKTASNILESLAENKEIN